MGTCHYAPDGWCDDPKCVEGCKKRRKAISTRMNFDGTPHVCTFNADGHCPTHATTQEAPISSKLRTIEPFSSRDGVTAEVHHSTLGGTGCVIIKGDTPGNEEAETILSAREAHDLMLWLQCALSANGLASETSAPSRGSIEYAIEVLERYRDGSDPECTCDDCPQCDRLPAECSGTQCAQTCQCSECDHCRVLAAIDGLKGSPQETAAPETKPPQVTHVEVERLIEWHRMAAGVTEQTDDFVGARMHRERLRVWEAHQRHPSVVEISERPCTCHPDDNPPRPCPRKYALSECREAAAERARVNAIALECAQASAVVRSSEKASADLCNGQALANCVKSPEHDGPCESRAGIQWPKPAMRCKHGKDWLGCRQCDREYLEATKCIACGHGNEYHFEDNYGNIVCRWSAECACVHRADSFPNGSVKP